MFMIVKCIWFQMGHYRSVTAMAKDIDLLVKNAKIYNEPGSQVFKVSSWDSNVQPMDIWRQQFVFNFLNCICVQDANTIKKIFAQKKSEIEHGDPVKSSVRIRYETTTYNTVIYVNESFILYSKFILFIYFLFFNSRHRRYAQGERLSAISMALQYESDEDGILSGTCLHHFKPNVIFKIDSDANDCRDYFFPALLRVCSLRRRRVRGGESDHQHRHE